MKAKRNEKRALKVDKRGGKAREADSVVIKYWDKDEQEEAGVGFCSNRA